MKPFLISIAMYFFSAIASAEPFGLEMGMTKEQVESSGFKLIQINEEKGWYRSTNGAGASGGLSDHTLVISPVHGLCSIVGFTPEFKTSPYGDEIKKFYANTEIELSKTFGNSRRFDVLKNKNVLFAPEDWTRSVAEKNRTYATFWSAKEGSLMKDSVTTVALSASAVGSTIGIVSVLYVFENYSSCK